MAQLPSTATIKLPPSFDPNADARQINSIIHQKGSSAEDLIPILVPRTINQRTQIMMAYQSFFQKDIIADINPKNGDLEDLLYIMFHGPINATAKEMAKKFKVDDIDDVLCLMKNSELQDFKRAYDTFKKGKLLEEAIHDGTKGYHTKLITSLLDGKKEEIPFEDVYAYYQEHKNIDGIVDFNLVCSDAKALHDAVEKKNVNEEVFTSIILARNDYHLKCVYMAFKDTYKVSLVDYIDKHCSKSLKNTLNSLVMRATDERLLLTAQLYNSMKGLGTKEKQLSRVIATRAENDLEVLKFLYEERVGKGLAETINSETSGEYRSYLMALMNVPMKAK